MGPVVVWECAAIRPTVANGTRTPNIFLNGVGLPFCLDQTMLQEMNHSSWPMEKRTNTRGGRIDKLMTNLKSAVELL